MKKTLLMFITAAIMAACTSHTAQNAWVKVEGNKFIDPQGNEIVFTTKYVTKHGKSFDYYIGKETREPVDVAGKKIGELPKCPYMTPAEFAEYMAGECTTDAGSYSKEVFNEAKKAVNKLVRLK